VANQLCHYGETDVTEMVKKVIQLYWSMRSYHKCVIHIKEPASELAGCPAECHLLEVTCEEAGNDR